MAEPFVKWAGGKRQLVPYIERLLPGDINTGDYIYVEPFVGGGALLFHMLKYHKFKEVYINDINTDLIDCYECVRDPKLYIELCSRLETLEDMYNTSKAKEEMFYDIRRKFNDMKNDTWLYPSVMKSAYFIFLNKASFNGLYRENKKGEYNTPWGKKTSVKLFDRENLKSCHELLNSSKVHISARDYSTVNDFSGGKVFVYLDPPYAALDNSKNFVSYTAEGFADEEQVRLHDYVGCLTKKGVKVMESNAKCEYIGKLYENYNVNELYAPRMINSKGDARGKIPETIITNY